MPSSRRQSKPFDSLRSLRAFDVKDGLPSQLAAIVNERRDELANRSSRSEVRYEKDGLPTVAHAAK